jgi:hypothetical protein
MLWLYGSFLVPRSAIENVFLYKQGITAVFNKRRRRLACYFPVTFDCGWAKLKEFDNDVSHPPERGAHLEDMSVKP